MTGTVRIAMWSGPRNISTAMMRAWASRSDTIVVDEPFYAAYLNTTGLDHPMAEAVIASQPTDWQVVADRCAKADGAPIVFQKHMTQHMIDGAPLDWMRDLRHAFLVRPPVEVAASFARKWPGFTAEDLGFRRQFELFEHVTRLAGAAPPVVLASDVLDHPGEVLAMLCRVLGVAYDPAMLSWPAGAQPTDGVWGAHWYNAVNSSTGFAPQDIHDEVTTIAPAIIDECQPYFDRLLDHRLKI